MELKRAARLIKIVNCLAVGVIVALMLYTAFSHAASGERIYREKVCTWSAREAVQLYDAIKENPAVILNSLFDSDEVLFEYIRQWVRDGKSREELAQYTRAHCLGEEI